MVNVSSWPLVSCLKKGGKKSFWESPSFTFMGSLLANPVDVSLLSRLKAIFLIFHTSLPPCSSLSHGCFGKSLKKGSPSAVCWANSFFPHWERITAFFGKCGCSPSVRCYFLTAEWAIFPCCFSYIWQRRWATAGRAWTWKWYEYGKTKTTLFAHELSSDQGCIQNIHGGSKPPLENIYGDPIPIQWGQNSLSLTPHILPFTCVASLTF